MSEVGFFAESAHCIGCGKPSVGIRPLLWSTQDGFAIEWPTCGHGKFVICPECFSRTLAKCPVCGCEELYT